MKTQLLIYFLFYRFRECGWVVLILAVNDSTIVWSVLFMHVATYVMPCFRQERFCHAWVWTCCAHLCCWCGAIQLTVWVSSEQTKNITSQILITVLCRLDKIRLLMAVIAHD